METGSELSKTVAIFIVQKILLDETGLTYICHTYERFFAGRGRCDAFLNAWAAMRQIWSAEALTTLSRFDVRDPSIAVRTVTTCAASPGRDAPPRESP